MSNFNPLVKNNSEATLNGAINVIESLIASMQKQEAAVTALFDETESKLFHAYLQQVKGNIDVASVAQQTVISGLELHLLELKQQAGQNPQ